MGVKKHYPEKDRDDDDGHGGSVEQAVASGQLLRASNGSTDASVLDDASGHVNDQGDDGNGIEVTAAATAIRGFPALSPPSVRTHPVEDEALLRRAGAGDPASFREIFVRHRRDVARLVYRMLNAPADLDDVVQEVFVQVFRSLKDFRGQSKFSTWLHRVTVNVVLMHRRSARSRPVLTEEAPSEIVADEGQALPDEEAERHERMRAFQRLLGRLAEKKRIVFVLHELEGLTPAEIAEIVGAPVLTVRTRLFYARRELEGMLGDEPALANLRASFSRKSEEEA